MGQLHKLFFSRFLMRLYLVSVTALSVLLPSTFFFFFVYIFRNFLVINWTCLLRRSTPVLRVVGL
jgi:hypothetical protein